MREKKEVRVVDTETTKPIEFASNKQVFIDWEFIEPGYGLAFKPEQQEKSNSMPHMMPYGVHLGVYKPCVMQEPLIKQDLSSDGLETDKGSVGGFNTLLFDEGIYKLWYSVTIESIVEKTDEIGSESVLCYAESKDGISWEKPKLGLFELNGNRNNNIVFGLNTTFVGSTVFKDPSGTPEERYKLICSGRPYSYNGKSKLQMWVYGSVSPDGIHWSTFDEPILKCASDTQDICFYSPEQGEYNAYLRGWHPQTRGGYGGRRTITKSVTKNFRKFPEPEIVMSPLPNDPPDLDFYSSAAQRWPGTKNAYFMMPAFYHRSSDIVDIHFAVSRDGEIWNRPSLEPIIPANQGSMEGAMSIYASVGVVPFGVNRWAFPLTQYHFPHNAGYRKHFKESPGIMAGGLYLATIREDGFMALETEGQGECWTQVICFRGSKLLTNSWAPYGGRVLIELTDEKGNPVSGYTMDECDGAKGDVFNRAMSWKGKQDVSFLEGRPIRMHFKLIRARLHSFQFIN